MNIISFNINALIARLHQLSAIIEKHNPDIIGLQEIKVSDEQFPLDDIKKLDITFTITAKKALWSCTA